MTLSGLSWHVLGHNFDSLDVQTKKFATILASHVRLLLLILQISLAKCTSPLHWSIVPLMCISSAPFNLTSHVQLAFGTSHPLFCACRLLCLWNVFLNSACKSWLNRGVTAAGSAAVSPTLAVIFLVALPLYMQQIGCKPSLYKSSCSSSALCMQQLRCSTLNLRMQGF